MCHLHQVPSRVLSVSTLFLSWRKKHQLTDSGSTLAKTAKVLIVKFVHISVFYVAFVTGKMPLGAAAEAGLLADASLAKGWGSGVGAEDITQSSPLPAQL